MMVDILVRNVEDDVAFRLKQRAAARGQSMNDAVRDALRASVKPSRAELLAEMDRIRAMSPYSAVDSTDLVREDRDNDEPHR